MPFAPSSVIVMPSCASQTRSLPPAQRISGVVEQRLEPEVAGAYLAQLAEPPPEPASIPRSCHDDPIVDSSALQGYAIRGQIGAGVWGTVSEAVDQRGRRVAVKELHPTLVADAEARRRFSTVAPLLASVDHPHIVRVVDSFDADGRCLLISEFLDGGTLRQRARGGVTPEVACALVLAIASGVERANRSGLLHRDLKPENVLFTSTGVAQVADFGLAEIVSGPRTLATRDGTVLGAPAYMAPELVRSEEPRPASDVYALATILYELLAGRLPFSDEGGGLSTMTRHVQETPADLVTAAPGVAPSIASVTMRGLAADPNDRHATADQFGAALADAAAQAWGGGWLRRTGISVTASDAVTERLHATKALEAPIVAETLAPPAATPAPGADETIIAPAVAPTPAPAAPPAAPASKRRTGLVLALVAALVLVAGGVGFALTRGGGGGPADVHAKAIRVDGKVAWTDTGIVVNANDDVSITASGTVFPASPNRAVAASPDGVPDRPGLRQYNVVGSADHSGLIGRVGDGGSPFAVGHAAQFRATTSGRLFLGINDTGVYDNDGAFDAKVTVTRK